MRVALVLTFLIVCVAQAALGTCVPVFDHVKMIWKCKGDDNLHRFIAACDRAFERNEYHKLAEIAIRNSKRQMHGSLEEWITVQKDE